MSNLLTTLISSANSLGVFERALLVSQNNVVNASTPGYAAQRVSLQAAPFDPAHGLVGGVRAGEIESTRNLYAEQSVRRQMESLGYFQQAAQSLTAIESYFQVSGAQGISGALTSLFNSFLAWSNEPNSTTARQAVVDNASQLAGEFRQTAADLVNVRMDTDQQLQQTISEINQIGEKLLAYNTERQAGGIQDAGLDTSLHTALEELSALVNFTTLYEKDGSVTVLIGGQTPLVIGAGFHPLSVTFSAPAGAAPVYAGAPAPARITGAAGEDVTSQIAQGKLAALLEIRNDVLPSLAGDAYHAGDLNLLAKAVASRVNDILTSGLVSDGPPPVHGSPLFAYDATSDAAVARTLALASGATAESLAAIQPGPPYASNGIALQLAALASPQEDADKIGGFSYVEYYGQIAGRVGRLLAQAQSNEDFKTQTVAQARTLRNELSGVSLDEEAIKIIEFQRAYQANARMVSVLADLTEIAIGLLD